MKAATLRKLLATLLVAIASILGYRASESAISMYQSINGIEQAVSTAE